MKNQNGDNPALPIFDGNGECFMSKNGDHYGLSKREMMAMNIMSGFASDSEINGSLELIAEAAVKWADALLNELDK